MIGELCSIAFERVGEEAGGCGVTRVFGLELLSFRCCLADEVSEVEGAGQLRGFRMIDSKVFLESRGITGLNRSIRPIP